MVLATRRRVAPRHLVLLGTIVMYVLAVSTFNTWWAGWSPPGRLLAVLTPLLAYYVAVVLQRLHSWIATTLAAIATMAGFLMSVTGDYNTVSRFTETGPAGNDPILNRISEQLHLGDVPHLLPTVRVTPDTGGYLLWYVAFLMFVAVVWLAGRYRPPDRIPVDPIEGLFPLLRKVRAARPSTAAGPPDEPHAGRRTATVVVVDERVA
jgi:hypothetical protein